MKKLMMLLMMTAAATSGPVLAHGAKPQHGGIVQEVNEVHYELVGGKGPATIHVADHGKPVPTAGQSGKLTVLNGAVKTELPLKPSGTNLLVTEGDATLTKGAKAVAMINLGDGKKVSVRFAVK